MCPFSCVGRSTLFRAHSKDRLLIFCVFSCSPFCHVPGNRPLSARRARRTTRSRRRASPPCGRSRRVRRALATALRAACASRRDLSPGTPPQAGAPGYWRASLGGRRCAVLATVTSQRSHRFVCHWQHGDGGAACLHTMRMLPKR